MVLNTKTQNLLRLMTCPTTKQSSRVPKRLHTRQTHQCQTRSRLLRQSTLQTTCRSPRQPDTHNNVNFNYYFNDIFNPHVIQYVNNHTCMWKFIGDHYPYQSIVCRCIYIVVILSIWSTCIPVRCTRIENNYFNTHRDVHVSRSMIYACIGSYLIWYLIF